MPIETGTSAAYLYSIGGIGIVGTLFGMPLDALILGGLAGAVVQGLHPAASRRAGVAHAAARRPASPDHAAARRSFPVKRYKTVRFFGKP